MTREELEKELIEKHGYKQGYVFGHGDSEPVGSGDFIIADVEKDYVLVPPESLFKDPVPYDEWF